MKNALPPVLLVFSLSLRAQYNVNMPANHWVDSVFSTLTDTQKIAQLMVVRLSSIDQQPAKSPFYDSRWKRISRRYNIGGICLFQGGPKQQAAFINHFQKISQDAHPVFHRRGKRTGHADGQCGRTSATNDARVPFRIRN